MRIVIIGGDAAGMSAATRIVAGAPGAELVVLERTRFTSYSACGIPFLVGGEVPKGADGLVARSPQEHRRRGVDVRTLHEATAIDVAERRVEAFDHGNGAAVSFDYDQLLVATGGEPVRPDLPGIDLPFVKGVQTLQDGIDLLEFADRGCRRVVIVGGGYIGLEMAEAFVNRGCTATVLERGAAPLSLIDADLGARVGEALAGRGVELHTTTDVTGFDEGVVHTAQGDHPADLVILGIGVGPRSTLAAEAGIELGVKRAIRVDRRQASTTDGVWAAGDCAESIHMLTDEPVHIALGTVANKQGRVAGTNIAGGDALTPKVLGTAITKVCDFEIALTGLTERAALDAGFDALATTIDSTTHAGYLGTAQPMTVRITSERATGRVLGGQIVGGTGAAMRIDTVVTAITAGMTVTQVSELDLAYAPPFSSVWDPVAIAARTAARST